MSAKKETSEMFTCEALFDLLDLAQDEGVPFRVDYHAEEGAICATLGIENLEVNREAEAIGFEIAKGGQISDRVYRTPEAYLRCEDPSVVSAVKERLLALDAPVAENGSMAIEFEPPAESETVIVEAEAREPICPRCGGFIPNDANPGAYPGALSRADNVTEVCSDCGNAEAMEDYVAWKKAGEPGHYVRGCSKDGWVRPAAAQPAGGN